MPILKSAAKRMRTSAKRHVRNTTAKTQIKSLRGDFFKAVQGKDKAAGGKLYREYCSLLDKSAKKGIISHNTAMRRKARAANQVRGLK